MKPGRKLRCLEYDVEDFARQLRRLQRRYKKEGGLSAGEEYLSGMKETDKLIPNITILLYHGAGKWKAARQLQDMIDMTALDERLGAMHMNYKLHVIDLTGLNEALFETGLRELVGIMKRVDDKVRMQRYIRDNAGRLQNMDDELYDLICTMAGIRDLTVHPVKQDNENGKERGNMCKAWEDMKTDSREKGRKEGRKEGEERLGTLINRLYQDGREADVPKAANSVRYRNKLYREYEILL